MIANCFALAAAGLLAIAPGSAISADLPAPASDRGSTAAEALNGSVSFFALQDRTRARPATANRARPSKPKARARHDAKPNINHNASRNRNDRDRNRNRNNNNRYTNVSNNNVNVNVNRNVRYDDYDHHHHHDHWDDWDDDWHPWATAAAVTMTAAVIGSIVASIPPDCSTVVVNGISYSQCGNTWYQPQYYGSSVQYVVVNPPR